MTILKFNNSHYIDQELFDAINNIQESSIQNGDSIYFTKNAEFPRNLLNTSVDSFTRTILPEKAKACVYGKIKFYGNWKYLHGDEIKDIQNEFPVFPTYNLTSKELETVFQLAALFNTNPLVRFVEDKNAIGFINSGQVLNSENVQEYADIYKGDRQLFFALIKNIDIEKCVPHFIYMWNNLINRGYEYIKGDVPTLWSKINEVTKLGGYSNTASIRKYLLKTEYGKYIQQQILNDNIKVVNNNLKQFGFKVNNLEIVEDEV